MPRAVVPGSPGRGNPVAQLLTFKCDAACCGATLQLETEMVDFHQQQAAWMDRMPEAPTFFPTREQFEDPLAYIRSIQQEAAQFGTHVYMQYQDQNAA